MTTEGPRENDECGITFGQKSSSTPDSELRARSLRDFGHLVTVITSPCLDAPRYEMCLAGVNQPVRYTVHSSRDPTHLTNDGKPLNEAMAPNKDASELHSDTWWRIKTGWTEAECLGRKNALLTQIRKVWPNKQARSSVSVQDFIDGIEPLIATFDDKAWCLPGEKDRTLVFAEQLRLYNRWAIHISSKLTSMSTNQLFAIPHANTSPALPLLASIADTTSPTNRELFDWNDVEIYVDLRVGGGADHYIPMVNLRSGDPCDVCQWHDFALSKLKEVIVSGEDGTCFCHENYAIYWIYGDEWFQIVTDSDYKKMLKRFMENPSKNASIELLIEDSRGGHDRPKLHPDKKKGCLKRKVPPS